MSAGQAIADSVLSKISNPADVGGRPAQLWSEIGLIHQLLIHQLELLMPSLQHRLEANLMASSIAFNVIKRDPLDVLSLAGTTFLGYLNKVLIVQGIFIDQGHYPELTEAMKNNLAANFRLPDAERLRYKTKILNIETVDGVEAISSVVTSLKFSVSAIDTKKSEATSNMIQLRVLERDELGLKDSP